MEDVISAVPVTSVLPLVAPQLSRHLLFPLIEFEEKQADDRGDAEAARRLLAGKLSLLESTNMTDYVAELHCQVHATSQPPAEYAQRRQDVLAQIERLEAETATISELLTREDVVSNLRSDKVANLEYLRNEHGVTEDMVNALYDLGQLNFRCGNYPDATHLLYQFRVLSTDNDKVSAATWGRLGAEILTASWDGAVEEVAKVKDNIETWLFSNARAQLDHRTMLIHWSLFPLFNHEPGRDTILDMLLSPAYINTIQTSCPWVLRYVVAAIVAGRNVMTGGANGRPNRGSSAAHQRQMKDVVRYVRQESYEYTDPITGFMVALFGAHDFDAARETLREAEAVCRADFFLAPLADGFVEAARYLICESYCKIYSRINMPDLSSKLGLDPDKGEKWIVDLIRDTRLDAKIDSREETVVMNHPPNNVYQQVIEKTKGGFFRTQVLTSAVSKS